MNKKAQKSIMAFALVLVVFILIITTFALIDPFKEFLDTARDSTSLNCVGTDSFNQTDFDDDTDFERLVKRPTCFVTGITMIYFMGTFIIASFIWLATNWRKISR